MSSLMWIIFFLLLAMLVVSLFWFVWRLRNFSQSNHHTVLDDKLLQSMLKDDALSKEVKDKLVRRQAGEAGINKHIDNIDNSHQQMKDEDPQIISREEQKEQI